MRLYQLLHAYSFEELMDSISEMFPGTEKYREPLNHAYEIMTRLTSVDNDRDIVYEVITGDDDESFMGAHDSCFEDTWEMCLGKNVRKTDDVDLDEREMLANAMVNMCFLGRYPHEFDKSHALLIQP